MFRKKYIIDYIRDWSLKGFGGYNVGPASQKVAQHYISIVPMYNVIWEVAFLATGMEKVTRIQQCLSPSNTGQSPNAVLMLGQRRQRGSTAKQHRVNVMCLLMCWRKVYSRPSV